MKSFYVKVTEDITQQMIQELFELCVSKGGAFVFTGSIDLKYPDTPVWFGVSPENQCQILFSSLQWSPGFMLTYEEALALFEEKEVEKPLFDSQKFEEFVKNEYGCVSISHSEKFTMITGPINFAPALEHLDYFSEIGFEYRSYSNNQMILRKI